LKGGQSGRVILNRGWNPRRRDRAGSAL